MKRLAIAVLAALTMLEAAPSFAADLNTPTAVVATATPAGSVSPSPALAPDRALSARTGGEVITGQERFYGGVVVGRPASGSTKIRNIGTGRCTFNLPSISAIPTPAPTPATSFGMVPTIVAVHCTHAGATVGDLVLGRLNKYHANGADNYDALWLQECSVITAGGVDCTIAYTGPSAIDPAVLSIDYMLLR